jgi:chromosome segregation ATPase
MSQTRINQLKKRIDEAYTLLEESEKELLTVSEPLGRDVLNYGIDELKKSIKKFEAELNVLQTSLPEGKLQAELAEMRQAKAQLQQELTLIKQELGENKNIIAELQAELTNISQIKEQLQQELNDTKQKLKEAQDIAFQVQIPETAFKATDISSPYDTREKELNQKLAYTYEIISKLEDSLILAQDPLTATHHEKNIERLKQQIESWNKELQEIKKYKE